MSFGELSLFAQHSRLKLSSVRVHRNGQKTTQLANVLVPGDLVTFHTGDRIPADLRLTQSHGLEIDESSLTGETKPVKKHTEAIVQAGLGVGGLPISERGNIAFMGTLVRNGRGEGIVVGTGKQSEFGVVFSMMQDVRSFCFSFCSSFSRLNSGLVSQCRSRRRRLLCRSRWMN